MRPQNFDNIPIVLQTKELLESDSAVTWTRNVRMVLGVHQLAEAEACTTMEKFI